MLLKGMIQKGPCALCWYPAINHFALIPIDQIPNHDVIIIKDDTDYKPFKNCYCFSVSGEIKISVCKDDPRLHEFVAFNKHKPDCYGITRILSFKDAVRLREKKEK